MRKRGRHDARAVANQFIARENPINVMQLLRYVYLAHGWYYGIYDKPLIKNEVQAWKYGPVIPDIFYSFHQQGANISHPLEGFDEEFTEKEMAVIQKVFDVYSVMEPYKVSVLTHLPQSPWDIASEKGFRVPIPDEFIREYYKSLVDEDVARTSVANVDENVAGTL